MHIRRKITVGRYVMEWGRRDDPHRILKRRVRIALAVKFAVDTIAAAERRYIARALAISKTISGVYLYVLTKIGDVGPAGGGPHRHRVSHSAFFDVLRRLSSGRPHPPQLRAPYRPRAHLPSGIAFERDQWYSYVPPFRNRHPFSNF